MNDILAMHDWPRAARLWYAGGRMAEPRTLAPVARPAGGEGERAAADRLDVRSSLSGDGDAFERIVRRHQQAVSRLLWRFTRRPELHEELIQETFVQAYWGLRGYSGKVPLAHWLARIAVRAGYRFWRQRRRERIEPLDGQAEPIDPRGDPAGGLQAAEAAQRVHDLLARLPDRDRLVLTLLYLEGRDIAGVADLTGWSRTMVKVQAWRARSRLRRLLKEVELRWT